MNTLPANISNGRIQFIDALRAYAILMMLQGHFTDTLLAEQFRDPSSLIFSTWKFMRGMTAPIFFTVTGLVFVFLLLRDQRPLFENVRVWKGIRRAFFLIFIGYLLRAHMGGLLKGEIYPSGLAADVLHIIGLALLALIGLFAVADRLRIPYPAVLGAAGLAMFYFTIDWKAADWSFFPRPLENYFTHRHGSVFILYPWIGYALMGGILGWHVSRFRHLYRTYWWPGLILGAGLLVTFFSTSALTALHRWTGLENLLDHANQNFIAWRFGQVMIVASLFMLMEVAFKRFPALMLKVGSETLTIYGVHYVLLYGSLFGIGLKTFWNQSLSPVVCAIGALSFVAAHVVLIAYIDDIRALPERARRAAAAAFERSGAADALRYRLRAVRVLGRRRVKQLAYQAREWPPVMAVQRLLYFLF